MSHESPSLDLGISSHLIDCMNLVTSDTLSIHVKTLSKHASLIGDLSEARHMMRRSIVGESLYLDSGVQAIQTLGVRIKYKKANKLVTSVTRHCPWPATYCVCLYCLLFLAAQRIHPPCEQTPPK